MSAGQQLAHRIPLLVVKAGFSALPLAVFAFDVIREVVDFGNAHLADRFLENVGARIERLEEGERERLKADAVYQMSGRSALQRLLTETNPRMADVLARAVAELGMLSVSQTEKMEIARSLDLLTEPVLHLLQTSYRVHNHLLTEREAAIAGDAKEADQYTTLICTSMPLSSWIAPVKELQRSGMVEEVMDDGWFAESRETKKDAEPRRIFNSEVFPLGEKIIHMCFDDPSVPAFGSFAPDA